MGLMSRELWFRSRFYFNRWIAASIRNGQVLQAIVLPNFSSKLEITQNGLPAYVATPEGLYVVEEDGSPVLLHPGYYYGLYMDESNNRLYGTDARDFSGQGFLRVMDLGGTTIDSIEAGIGPNSILVLD